MQIVKKYGEHIKEKVIEHPQKALKMIKLGLNYENFRTKAFPDKNLPRAYQKLTNIAVNSTLNALKYPERSVWTNIFTPVEILQCFKLNSISLECLSSFISAFQCEDYFIDYAENCGIASTLCSYHKNFIGAVDAGVLPKPAFAVTTSMVCDGNINTFRYLTDKYDIDEYTLDIPHEYSKENEDYVVVQLKEMIAALEEKFHMKLDMNELKEILKRENQSKDYYKQFLEYQKERYYPNTLTLNLFMLFATHLNIGSMEVNDFFRLLAKEIGTYPKSTGTNLFWVHLFPYYQETLKSYFNCNQKYQIKACDINLDYMEMLDIEHPLEALAKKMILNIYNGSFKRKVELISKLVEQYEVDGVVHFCHWGCRQSSGGVMLLKEEMKKQNIPMLIIDGDGMDRRNSHDGQIKTRLEAFLEMLDSVKEDSNDRVCL